MAISLYSYWEVQSLGNNNNSGVFDPNTTMSATLSSANGTSILPTITASNYSFVSSDVGNWLYVKSGTNWYPGWYQISSIAGTSAIVNANNFQAVNANLQGAFRDGIGSASSLSSGTWAIDYSQKSSSFKNYSDLVLLTSTSLTSAGNTFYPSMIGNSIRIMTGSGFTAGLYVISSMIGVTATIDRAAGTQGSTGGTGLLGGALADLPTALIGSTAISDKTIIYVKADGTYNWNSDTFIPGSGCYQNIIGYGTYRYDQSRVSVSIGASSTFIKNASFMKIFNFVFDGGGNANSIAINNNNFGGNIYNCHFKNLTGCLNFTGTLMKGLVQNCTNINIPNIHDTVLTGCTAIGNTCFFNASFEDCLIYNNSASQDLISVLSSLNRNIYNNTFYNNTAPKLINLINTDSRVTTIFTFNNIFSGNSGTVFNVSSGYHANAYDMVTNAFYNNGAIGSEPPNTLGSHINFVEDEIILTGDPFINAANADFRLNNIVGAGASCRNRGLMPLNPFFTIQNYMNIGSVQSKNPYINFNLTGGIGG
jgi:hypothetical protein